MNVTRQTIVTLELSEAEFHVVIDSLMANVANASAMALLASLTRNDTEPVPVTLGDIEKATVHGGITPAVNEEARRRAAQEMSMWGVGLATPESESGTTALSGVIVEE